jgi:ABC-2 type transport system ATP-binding protein
MSNLLRTLQTETFLLTLRAQVDVVPDLPGFRVALVDDHTLEVEVHKEQSLNEAFAALSARGLEVLSMRNKVNRLEEMFMRLVENRTP